MVDQELAHKLVQGRPWHHDFEIIPGVRTYGAYDPSELWNDLQLPSGLHGLSLADVGASNGYFSFAARQRGARVVAFDYRHKANSGFGLAQYINGLDDIEHHHINVLEITAAEFGEFDIVLALGLPYHVADPYRCLANCAALSRDKLLIESYCIDSLLASGLADEPLMRFISDSQRFPDRGQPNTDRSNFWGFTAVCLQRLLEDVGFAVHRTIFRRERVLIEARRAVNDDAATRLRLAYGVMTPEIMLGDPNEPAAWRIF